MEGNTTLPLHGLIISQKKGLGPWEGVVEESR